jgi:hypothetical protein
MAEGDTTIYNDFKEQILSGKHNLVNGGHAIKITLHNGYTPNIDTHQVWTDVSGTEYGTGDGYTAGGVTLANQSVTADDSNDQALFDADDASWAALGPMTPAIPSHAIIWNDGQTSPADPLICYIELGVTAPNGATYNIAFSTSPSGILRIT